ncbi:twin-arginine translocase TatA/TatE family subunit [uncultured Alistipes sp.]|uniref:twin-arginine translocase TatA/TatE family subunit n=1 Tax=uncultured Alistipes sp. TaxID=538949 RepID=UPI0026044E4D|nr:twin-arginine translocase TatA/TatE family subunit [uncultured Alistipes sp.]
MNSLPLLIMGFVGPWQWVLIVALVLLLFGGKKIPELMRGMGRGLKEFKDAVNKDYSAEETPAKTNETAKPTDEVTK